MSLWLSASHGKHDLGADALEVTVFPLSNIAQIYRET
jgi:hypothetical protein